MMVDDGESLVVNGFLAPAVRSLATEARFEDPHPTLATTENSEEEP